MERLLVEFVPRHGLFNAAATILYKESLTPTRQNCVVVAPESVSGLFGHVQAIDFTERELTGRL